VATTFGNFVIPAMVVPILARPNLLDEMLATIDYPIEHLVIIDNGHCVKEVTAKHVHNIHIVTMPTNLGVSGSWNLGIKSLPFSAYWLITNFDVTWPAGSLERFAKEATAHELVLSGASPPWAAFALGSAVVNAVGLFDEALHPAYFEDLDYERRCERIGPMIRTTNIPVRHQNSSTIKAGYEKRNDETYDLNRSYYENKMSNNDYSEGSWNIRRRRLLTWD
jgi:GT2 family glycosyltransferase